MIGASEEGSRELEVMKRQEPWISMGQSIGLEIRLNWKRAVLSKGDFQPLRSSLKGTDRRHLGQERGDVKANIFRRQM